MSAAGRSTDAGASDLRADLEAAEFVRLVAAGDADSVAAATLLAKALEGVGVPFQTSVTPLAEPADRSTDADLTVSIGRPTTGGDLTIGLEDVASRTAYTAASELGTADLPLALVGAVARDGHPGDELATLARQQGIERTPGVAVPTTDLADGVAHSTLVHAPFSADPEAVESRLEALDLSDDSDGRRRLASDIALAVASDPAGTPQGSEAVERFLRPLSGGPFGTIGGYADVLDAVARERPGLAVVLAMGRLDESRALEIWRGHARQAHETIREAKSSRYDGLYIVRWDGRAPVGTVARLVVQYRSPEPVVLAVGTDRGAVHAREDASTDVGSALEAATTAVGGTAGSTRQRGRAVFETDPTEFVAAFTEAV